MGAMLRRYWIPALLSEELEPEGASKRVRLLGEDLVAFRDRAGTVGLFHGSSPYRGASTRESGGVVWTYLGPAGTEPPFPSYDWTLMPATHRQVFKARAECNWVQALEGVIDSAHSNFLHRDAILPAAVTRTVYRSDMQLDRPSDDVRPRLDVQTTAYGFRYAAIRKPIIDPERTQYVRVTLFIAPFSAMFPAPEGLAYMQSFVPIDDEHTMFYFFQGSYERPFDAETRARRELRAGMRPGIDLDADFRRVQRRENDWMQDRASMRGPNGSFSGIFGVQNQDMAVQESMGKLYDRRKEHLGTSDVAVIRMRRVMLDSVRAFTERGEPPVGLAEPVPYERLRAQEKIIPLDVPWQTVGAFAGEPTLA